MALNRKTFPKVTAAADTFTPSEHFNTVLYTGNGGTQRIGGYINRGAVFNGSSSYISTSNPLGTGNVAYSISAWIYLNASSHTGGIYTIWDGGTNVGTYLFFKVEAGKISIGNYGGAITSTNTLPVGQWVHVAVTRDTSNNVVLYVNGTSDTTGTLSLNLANNNPKIGALNTTTQNFNGKIDQVRLFNKALSSSEVTTLYGETYASSTVSTTDIFSDGSAVALYQLDGNANDTGGVSGKYGSAAIFDGSSSYISTSYIVPASSTASISCWFNTSSTGNYRTLFSDAPSNGAAVNTRMQLYFTPTSTFEIVIGNNSGYWLGSSNSISSYIDGDWHNIIVTYSGTAVDVYIDGSLFQQFTSNISFGTLGNQSLVFGKAGLNNVNYWLGKIDDVRIYSDVLTSTEVGYIYNNTTASIPTDNLVAHYKFDGDARDEQQLYDGTATNVTYAYDGTATNVTYQEATKFTPDLVWIKARTGSGNHSLFDSIRGVQKYLLSNSTVQETDFSGDNGVTSFDSNGFTIDDTGALNYNVNDSGNTYVAWCWKAGGAAVSNTDGTITSQVSANQDAGFSIVKYTGNATNGATVGHGLSAAPEMIIIKNTVDAENWSVYSSPTGNTQVGHLNLTNAFSTTGDWNNTTPTTSVFTVGTSNRVNTTDNFIAYCFHSVDGYQKIGSYTGTGAAGNFIETGFEVGWILIKKTTTAASYNHWYILDVKRDTDSSLNKALIPSLSNSEATYTSDYVDLYSNGFSPNGGFNTNGVEHIYLAIAADPDETTPIVENSFDVVTYTGDGTTSQIIDVDFKPDLVWVKARALTQAPNIFDSIRGGELLRTSLTSASSGDYIDYIDDGFQFKLTDAGWNQSGQNYVAWCWKAGDHDDNLPEINTNGTIDSVVSVNDAAGFSIVKYDGTGTAGSYGHGLSSAPEMIITKNIDWDIPDWFVYHKDLGTNGYLRLNQTTAEQTASTLWSSAPTSTVVNIGNDSGINRSAYTQIAYCWHSVSGYSKIGSYSGGSTGSSNEITTGFSPRWLMIKRTDTTSQWLIHDTTRGEDLYLYPNLSSAEGGPDNIFDFTSNGFYFNGTNADWNASGGTYIYLAIA